MPRLNLQEVTQRLSEENDIMCSSCDNVAVDGTSRYCQTCADYWNEVGENYEFYDPEPEDDYIGDLEYDRLQAENDLEVFHDWQDDVYGCEWDSHYR